MVGVSSVPNLEFSAFLALSFDTPFPLLNLCMETLFADQRAVMPSGVA